MNNFFPQLAWLRGFAALAVVIYHIRRGLNVSYTGVDPAIDNSIFKAMDLGEFGVLLFFVLSGTTLYLSYADRISIGTLKPYLYKRLFRIWPAFFVSMIIYIAFIPVFSAYYIPELKGYWIEVHADNNFNWYDIIKYLSLVFNVTGPQEKFNIVYWSLPIEFQYYLIFPVLIISLRYLSYAGPIIVGATLYGLLHTDLRFLISNSWTLMLAYTFCGGVLVGYFYERWKGLIRLPIGLGLIGALLLMSLASYISQYYNSLPEIIRNTPIIGMKMNMFGLTAILIVGVMLFTKVDKCASNKVARLFNYLGEISYSVYLYHCLFIAISVLFVVQFEINSYWIKLWSMLIFTTVSTILFSHWSYRYIELPGMKLTKSKLIKP